MRPLSLDSDTVHARGDGDVAVADEAVAVRARERVAVRGAVAVRAHGARAGRRFRADDDDPGPRSPGRCRRARTRLCRAAPRAVSLRHAGADRRALQGIAQTPGWPADAGRGLPR